MPRRNLLALLVIAIASVICYRQADTAHRSEYGRMFDTMTEVFNEVDRHALRKVEDRVLFEGALQGMVSKLDPYSAYIGPDHYGDFQSMLKQKFDGIGIKFEIDDESKLPIVVSPMVDSPAYLAGIRAGDQILEIDGASPRGQAMQDIVKLLRGKSGEPVVLTVQHQGDRGTDEITIRRGSFPVPVVLGDTRDADNHWNFFLHGHEGIGYVRITTFGDNTVKELKAALAWLAERHAKGLILDLRNNGGGVLTEATETCDLFLPAGRIVSTRGRDGNELKSWDASGDAPYGGLPMVVLVNQFSASASEIVSACLQDHNRAVIVGQRTWGKGTVQDVIPLEGGRSGLKLTTASFWRPSGQDLHKHQGAKDDDPWGVKPNPGYEVKLSDDETGSLAKQRDRRDVVRPAGQAASDSATTAPADEVADPQLEKGLEALQTLLKERAESKDSEQRAKQH